MSERLSSQAVEESKVNFGGSHSHLEAFSQCVIVHTNIENFIATQPVVSWRHYHYFKVRSLWACIDLAAPWDLIDERKISIITEVRILREVYARFWFFVIYIEGAPYCTDPFNHDHSCDPNRASSEVDDVKTNGASQAQRKTLFVLLPCQFDHVLSYSMVGLSAHLFKLTKHGCNCGRRRQCCNPSAERSYPLPRALHAAFAWRRSYSHTAEHGYGRCSDDQDRNDRCKVRHGLIGALPKVVTRIHVNAPRYRLLRSLNPFIRLSNCIELSIDCCFHQVERCRARADAAKYCRYFAIVRRRCECTRERFDGRCCRLNVVVTPAPRCANGDGDLRAAVDTGKRSSQCSAPQKVVEYWRAWVFRCRVKQIMSAGLGTAIILDLRQQAFQVTLDPSVARTPSCFEVCFLLVDLVANCGNRSGRSSKCECPGYQRLPIIDETAHAVAGASSRCGCVRPCPDADQRTEPKTDHRTDGQPKRGFGKWNNPTGVLAQWSESTRAVGESEDIWRRDGRLGNLVAAPTSRVLFALAVGRECVG